jgi:hypothetical protein
LTVLLAEQAVLEGELRATCYNHSMFVMMKSIVIFAILLLGAAAFGNYCSLLSAASPSPTPEPAHVATLTPPQPNVSFTLWHTNSPVIQPPANELTHIPPICEIESPENQTILQTNNFTLNVNVASYFWIIGSVYYEADWIAGIHQIFGIQPHETTPLNASITVNFSEIPDGNHTLTVFANTHDDSHSFATVIFSTETHPPNLTKPAPFPTVTVAAVFAVTVIVAVAGLLVYHKKLKQAQNDLQYAQKIGITIK